MLDVAIYKGRYLDNSLLIILYILILHLTVSMQLTPKLTTRPLMQPVAMCSIFSDLVSSSITVRLII